MTKGYLVLAQNTKETNYIDCADALALSLKKANPKANITLLSNDVSMCAAFDNVIELPYGDLEPNSAWKLVNDWQVYEASPYDHTIKLEADMIVNTDIDYLFDVLSLKDVCVCTTIRDYKQQISDVRFYRKFIDDNNLPDVYNAVTYFKKSPFAELFFKNVRFVFEHWYDIIKKFKCNIDELPTTDWVYSIVCHIMGVENTTIPCVDGFSFVHMKQHVNNLITDDWKRELVYELTHPIRIQKIPQSYIFHYHNKDFAKIVKEEYGRV
jgi:hypothetical protein